MGHTYDGQGCRVLHGLGVKDESALHSVAPLPLTTTVATPLENTELYRGVGNE